MDGAKTTGRVRVCGHCGRKPELKTERRDAGYASWLVCSCGIVTAKRFSVLSRHAESEALHHWNTRDGEQKVSHATHGLRVAALAFVSDWRNGDFELPKAATPDAVAIEKALGRVFRSLTGDSIKDAA